MYTLIKVQSWAQVREISDELVLWGFRGQENADWQLETTLDRIAKLYNHPRGLLWHREYWMVRQFHRRAHHFCSGLPSRDQKIDWLALMQHYGAPTRLLDFSHSLYVAAFFALERAEADVAIWAINISALRDLIARFFSIRTSTENIDMTNMRHIEVANDCICTDGKGSRQSHSVILNLEPELLHQRLLTQQGFFLFQCDLSKPFFDIFSDFLMSSGFYVEQQEAAWDNDFIESLRTTERLMLKIVIPKTLIPEGIGDLEKMNITAATLFPGLDGFARSMRYHFSSFAPWAKSDSKHC